MVVEEMRVARSSLVKRGSDHQGFAPNPTDLGRRVPRPGAGAHPRFRRRIRPSTPMRVAIFPPVSAHVSWNSSTTCSAGGNHDHQGRSSPPWAVRTGGGPVGEIGDLDEMWASPRRWS